MNTNNEKEKGGWADFRRTIIAANCTGTHNSDSDMHPQLANVSELQAISILPTNFRYGGFAFEQLQRTGDVVLFVKRKGNVTSYEVAVVQRYPARTIVGKAYGPREAMPRSEQWGSAGWSLTTLDRAQEKFREVVKSRRESRFSPECTAEEAFSAAPSVPDADGRGKEAS